MAWIGIVIQLVPIVVKLMQIAEELLGSGTGADKKSYVMAAVKALFDAADSVYNNEMWDKVEAAISPLIDFACDFLFPKENEK